MTLPRSRSSGISRRQNLHSPISSVQQAPLGNSTGIWLAMLFIPSNSRSRLLMGLVLPISDGTIVWLSRDGFFRVGSVTEFGDGRREYFLPVLLVGGLYIHDRAFMGPLEQHGQVPSFIFGAM